ncbi:hypothetical protein [Paracoccus ravus]|uniref:hypothetical protein n=1 Tax=Paracoccus ravus TaxID=2447760 RepID=UPI0014306782|nr:hypothetical protein [Paracoccus ravus]
MPHPVRAWLIAFAVVLMAAMPGPQAPDGKADFVHLTLLHSVLTGHETRQIVSRSDAVQARATPDVDLPHQPGAPPPAAPAILILSGTNPIQPGARSPPPARARAPPLS